MADVKSSLSGLTDGEAQEFHKLFMQGFIGFTIVAVIAHILAWIWRPWLPGEGGYAAVSAVQTAMIDSGQQIAHVVMQFSA
ncbi:MAG: light-harvesting protein [Rhizobiales bacterium]|nr:light-harvesting protein [Hyphomicrobiales bacterium]